MAGKTSFPFNAHFLLDRGIVDNSIKEGKITFALPEITKLYEYFGAELPTLLHTVAMTQRAKVFWGIRTKKKREITMSVSAISSTNSVSQNNWQSDVTKGQQYFKALGQALQSGNLSAAKSAFSSLQQLTSSSSQTSSTTGGAGSANSVASAFNALGQALQSGNLSAAQQAFSQVQQTVQTAQSGQSSSGQSKAASASTSAAATPSTSVSALTSASTSTVSQSTLNQIQTDVNEGMTTSQIAQQLGISVTTLMQEAQAAGITLNGSSSSSATSGNPAVGNNVNTTA